jgi:hypothetical protein
VGEMPVLVRLEVELLRLIELAAQTMKLTELV